MSTTTLCIVLIAAATTALLAIVGRRMRDRQQVEASMGEMPYPAEVTRGEQRTAVVRGLLNADLEAALDAFARAKGQQGEVVAMPSADDEGDRHVLTFPPTMDFDTFGQWIRHLSVDSGCRPADVTGWYEMGIVGTLGAEALEGETLMVFATDRCRNHAHVYFTTPGNHCFRMELNKTTPLKLLAKPLRDYVHP